MILSYPELGFRFSHHRQENIENNFFRLHNHKDTQEIFIFLQGDAEFLVEGTRYSLHPYDIILAQNFEMHNIHHNNPAIYERIVIDIDNSFFVKHNCESYKEIFTNRPLGVNNCIPASAVIKYGIPDLLKRLFLYLNDSDDNGIAALSSIIELLYLLNRIGTKTDKGSFHNDQIKDIILYINDHLTELLSLDDIASRFYISKCHLCRSFKKYTGYTVNQYVTHKRLLLVRELVSNGKSWIEASEGAGFGNYSNFYKIYCRTYGHSPTGR